MGALCRYGLKYGRWIFGGGHFNKGAYCRVLGLRP